MLILEDSSGVYWTRRLVANCLGVCKQTVINWEKQQRLIPDKVLHDGTRLFLHNTVMDFKKTNPKHKRMKKDTTC